MKLFYQHATRSRNASYPLISGDTFRAFADHVFDETASINTWPDKIRNMADGDILFLKTDMLSSFFPLFNTINCSFILISHNSDNSAPGTYKTYLNDARLLAWFTQNPDTYHPKLYTLPIGLANMRWPHGNLNELMFAFHNHRRPFGNREILVYVNFDVNTNTRERTDALDQVKTIQNVRIIKQKIPFSTYLNDIGNTKFVLSPRGNGLDCHRTWEALLMGAVPIVHTGELDSLFVDTPVIIVKAWSDVTENYLLSLNFTQFDNTGARIKASETVDKNVCSKMQSMLSYGKYHTTQMSSNITYVKRDYPHNFLAYSPINDIIVFVEPNNLIHVYNSKTMLLLANISTNEIVIAGSCAAFSTTIVPTSPLTTALFFIYQNLKKEFVYILSICQMNFNLIQLVFTKVYCIEPLEIHSKNNIKITGFTIKKNHQYVKGKPKSLLFISSDIGIIYSIFDSNSGLLYRKPMIMNETLNEGNIVLSSSGFIFYASMQDHTNYELFVTKDFRIKYGKIMRSNAIKYPFGLITDECNHLYIATKSMILVMNIKTYTTIRNVFSKSSELPISIERLNTTTFIYATIKKITRTRSVWMFNLLEFNDSRQQQLLPFDIPKLWPATRLDNDTIPTTPNITRQDLSLFKLQNNPTNAFTAQSQAEFNDDQHNGKLTIIRETTSSTDVSLSSLTQQTSKFPDLEPENILVTSSETFNSVTLSSLSSTDNLTVQSKTQINDDPDNGILTTTRHTASTTYQNLPSFIQQSSKLPDLEPKNILETSSQIFTSVTLSSLSSTNNLTAQSKTQINDYPHNRTLTTIRQTTSTTYKSLPSSIPQSSRFRNLEPENILQTSSQNLSTVTLSSLSSTDNLTVQSEPPINAHQDNGTLTTITTTTSSIHPSLSWSIPQSFTFLNLEPENILKIPSRTFSGVTISSLSPTNAFTAQSQAEFNDDQDTAKLTTTRETTSSTDVSLSSLTQQTSKFTNLEPQNILQTSSQTLTRATLSSLSSTDNLTVQSKTQINDDPHNGILTTLRQPTSTTYQSLPSFIQRSSKLPDLEPENILETSSQTLRSVTLSSLSSTDNLTVQSKTEINDDPDNGKLRTIRQTTFTTHPSLPSWFEHTSLLPNAEPENMFETSSQILSIVTLSSLGSTVDLTVDSSTTDDQDNGTLPTVRQPTSTAYQSLPWFIQQSSKLPDLEPENIVETSSQTLSSVTVSSLSSTDKLTVQSKTQINDDRDNGDLTTIWQTTSITHPSLPSWIQQSSSFPDLEVQNIVQTSLQTFSSVTLSSLSTTDNMTVQWKTEINDDPDNGKLRTIRQTTFTTHPSLPSWFQPTSKLPNAEPENMFETSSQILSIVTLSSLGSTDDLTVDSNMTDDQDNGELATIRETTSNTHPSLPSSTEQSSKFTNLEPQNILLTSSHAFSSVTLSSLRSADSWTVQQKTKFNDDQDTGKLTTTRETTSSTDVSLSSLTQQTSKFTNLEPQNILQTSSQTVSSVTLSSFSSTKDLTVDLKMTDDRDNGKLTTIRQTSFLAFFRQSSKFPDLEPENILETSSEISLSSTDNLTVQSKTQINDDEDNETLTTIRHTTSTTYPSLPSSFQQRSKFPGLEPENILETSLHTFSSGIRSSLSSTNAITVESKTEINDDQDNGKLTTIRQTTSSTHPSLPWLIQQISKLPKPEPENSLETSSHTFSSVTLSSLSSTDNLTVQSKTQINDDQDNGKLTTIRKTTSITHSTLPSSFQQSSKFAGLSAQKIVQTSSQTVNSVRLSSLSSATELTVESKTEINDDQDDGKLTTIRQTTSSTHPSLPLWIQPTSKLPNVESENMFEISSQTFSSVMHSLFDSTNDLTVDSNMTDDQDNVKLATIKETTSSKHPSLPSSIQQSSKFTNLEPQNMLETSQMFSSITLSSFSLTNDTDMHSKMIINDDQDNGERSTMGVTSSSSVRKTILLDDDTEMLNNYMAKPEVTVIPVWLDSTGTDGMVDRSSSIAENGQLTDSAKLFTIDKLSDILESWRAFTTEGNTGITDSKMLSSAKIKSIMTTRMESSKQSPQIIDIFFDSTRSSSTAPNQTKLYHDVAFSECINCSNLSIVSMTKPDEYSSTDGMKSFLLNTPELTFITTESSKVIDIDQRVFTSNLLLQQNTAISIGTTFRTDISTTSDLQKITDTKLELSHFTYDKNIAVEHLNTPVMISKYYRTTISSIVAELHDVMLTTKTSTLTLVVDRYLSTLQLPLNKNTLLTSVSDKIITLHLSTTLSHPLHSTTCSHHNTASLHSKHHTQSPSTRLHEYSSSTALLLHHTPYRGICLTCLTSTNFILSELTHSHLESTQQQTMLPLTYSSSVVPLTHSSSMLPSTYPSSMPPSTYSSSMPPSTYSSSMLPSTYSSSVVPLTYSSSMLPLKYSSSTLYTTNESTVSSHPITATIEITSESSINTSDSILSTQVFPTVQFHSSTQMSLTTSSSYTFIPATSTLAQTMFTSTVESTTHFRTSPPNIFHITTVDRSSSSTDSSNIEYSTDVYSSFSASIGADKVSTNEEFLTSDILITKTSTMIPEYSTEQYTPSSFSTQKYDTSSVALSTDILLAKWHSEYDAHEDKEIISLVPPSGQSGIDFTPELLSSLLASDNATSSKIIKLDLNNVKSPTWKISLKSNLSFSLLINLPEIPLNDTKSQPMNLTFADIDAVRFETNIVGSSANVDLQRIETKQFAFSMDSSNLTRNTSVIFGHVKSDKFLLNLTKSNETESGNMNVEVRQVDSSTAELFLSGDFCTNENGLQINLNLTQNGSIRYGDRKPLTIGPVFTRVHMLKQSCDRDQPLVLFFDVCLQQNPCLNSGTCISLIPDYNSPDDGSISQSGNVGYTCKCPKLTSGEHCELMQYPFGYCLNGGDSSHPNDENITCICPSGFTGVHCEININNCESITCSSHGMCEDSINSYRCVCYKGYDGPNCENINFERVVIELTTKSFAIVAILLIVSIAGLVIASDIHTYVTKQKKSTKPKQQSELLSDAVLLLGFVDAPTELKTQPPERKPKGQQRLILPPAQSQKNGFKKIKKRSKKPKRENERLIEQTVV
ncbi:unnamed protein product [Didymodactylos carnosus]|uniref:EGF-like domain-containing protein n=1 Tax=Didymodactylos carnosus TaxID=1234261 RepID=A0A8S2H115_9BILA|nr:unnamed protein product [Didymodactylos carnosus]